MSLTLYFAYGSNLHVGQFKRRCPGAVVVGRARLPDHQLAFTRYSRNERGGVADIVPQSGASVWGTAKPSLPRMAASVVGGVSVASCRK